MQKAKKPILFIHGDKDTLVDRKGNIVGEPMVGGIDNQENYDTLMKQIKSVIEADSANK